MNIVALRKKLGLNQSDFWRPIGISQSGGSRYETGRTVPASILMLVHLRWVQGHHDLTDKAMKAARKHAEAARASA